MKYDWDTIILVAFIAVTMIIALKSVITYVMTFRLLSKRDNERDMTGCEVAQKLLEDSHLSNVYVVETKGILRNYYDSSRKVIRLSHDMFHGKSQACLLICAYIAAHAVQDKNGNTLLKIRDNVEKVMPIISALGYLGLLVSILSINRYYILLSLGVFACITIFYGIMWHLEKEASELVFQKLDEWEWITEKEKEKTQKYLEILSFVKLGYFLKIGIETIQYLFHKEEN